MKGYKHCKLPSLRLSKRYECCELQHVDWKATNLQKPNVHVLQMWVAAVPNLPPAVSYCKQGMQDYTLKFSSIPFCPNGGGLRPPTPPRLFCNASTMPTSPITEAGRCDLYHFFYWGTCALPNLPRSFVMETQCETDPSNGCKKLGVLIFVNVLQMLRNVSTMHNTTCQRAQVCSDVLILARAFQLRGAALPPTPAPICNASASLEKRSRSTVCKLRLPMFV